MKTRVITAFLLAFGLVAIPATATHRQEPYEALVRWATCRAELVTNDDYLTVESYYMPDGSGHGVLYIGTKDMDGLPRELSEMMLFHEIGHCLQDQAGLLSDPAISRVQLELDADRWAADLACGLHRDGKRLLRDLFIWTWEQFGYEGDIRHGTLAQRMAQGDNAAMCKLIPIQAPVTH